MPGGRPRKYETGEAAAKAHAEQERARREGRVSVSRAAAEELVAAIDAAAAAGDELARDVRTGGIDSLLRNLALAFRRRAEAHGADDR